MTAFIVNAGSYVSYIYNRRNSVLKNMQCSYFHITNANHLLVAVVRWSIWHLKPTKTMSYNMIMKNVKYRTSINDVCDAKHA